MGDHSMRLDYQIIHLEHPHYVRGKGCVYDHINWTIWVSNEMLMNDLNKTFKLHIPLEQKYEVNEELAYQIWHYISDGKYIGTFGCDYDRSILDIYKDLEDKNDKNLS